jgi:hypothetical protein
LITRWDRVGKWFIAQLKMLPLMMFGGLLMLLGTWLGFEHAKEEARLHDEFRKPVANVAEAESYLLQARRHFES